MGDNGHQSPSKNVPWFAATREEAQDEEDDGVETGSGSAAAESVARLHRAAAPPCAFFSSKSRDNESFSPWRQFALTLVPPLLSSGAKNPDWRMRTRIRECHWASRSSDRLRFVTLHAWAVGFEMGAGRWF